MSNQEIRNPNTPRQPISPFRITQMRLVGDIFLLAITILFVFPMLDQSSGQIVLGAALGILAGTLIGYQLIRRNQVVTGMGFVIYGLVLGLSTISVFVDGIGLFIWVAIMLITILSVTYAIPARRLVEAIVISFLFATASLIYDLSYRGAEFRLTVPAAYTPVFWVIIAGILVAFLYYFAQQFTYFTLRAKLISSFAAIMLLSLAVLGLLNNARVENILTAEANQSLYNAAEQTEDTLQQFITFNLQTISTESKLPLLREYMALPASEQEALKPQVAATLAALAEKDPDYLVSYALLNANGDVLMDTFGSHMGTNEASLSAFQMAIQANGPIMSDVLIDPFTEQPSLYFSTPMLQEDGNLLGVLRIRYKADILQSLIENNNGRAGENSFAVLFDENLIHLAHGVAPETLFTSVGALDFDTFQRLIDNRRLPNQTAQETFLDLPELQSNLQQLLSSSNDRMYFEAQDIATGDLANQVVVVKMENTNWLVAFFQPQQIYLAPIQQLTNNTVFLSLVSVLGAAVIALALSQVIVNPILNLTNQADKLTEGDFSTRVSVTTDDEIGNLGKTFNSMASQLQNLVNNLENQVASRTRALENRAAQLQAAAEVSRDAISEQALNDLLDRAATLIYERFGYYHVGIYLKDQNEEYAILSASSDTPGQKLIASEHNYRINPDSNVGYAFILGKAILASVEDPTTQPNFHPLLPNSMSQLVLPLNIGSQTIGVLDIHSTNPTAFTNEDVQIFQILADQLAIAIQKAKVQDEMRQALDELENAYGVYTRESWHRFLQSRKNLSGYRYNKRHIEEVFMQPKLVRDAWEQGEKVILHEKSPLDPNSQTTSLAIPLKVRGEVISVINMEFETDDIPPDTSTLINEISDRLSLILENARLIETAQRKVEREQLTSHISNKIRQSLDMDLIIRTTVQEIGESLGLSEVELRLGTEEELNTAPSSKTNGHTEMRRN